MPSQPRMPYGSNDFQSPYNDYDTKAKFVHPTLEGDLIENVVEDQPPAPPTRAATSSSARRNAPPTVINGPLVSNANSAGDATPTPDAAGGAMAPARLFGMTPRLSGVSIGPDGTISGGMADIYEEEGEEEEDFLNDDDDEDVDGRAGMMDDMMMEDEDDYKRANDDGHDEELNEDDVVAQLLPQPPDGGFGWIIVIMSFLLNMIVDGISYSFAILLTTWLDYFHDSKGKTAWIGSLLTGVYLLIGPITSALVNSYGCRTISMAGSIIAGMGFALSALAPSTTYLIVTYGIMGGIGFGFIYLPAIVLLSLYFVKKRAIATGIAVAGSGVGGFLFPPIISWLLSVYSWRDTMLIMAGIALQGCVCGALMRPLEPQITVVDRRRRASQAISSGGVGGGGQRGSADDDADELYEETAVAAAQEAAARRSGAGDSADINAGIDIEVVGDKVRYNPDKLKVSGLLKRMKIAREVAKKQREEQRVRYRHDSEMAALETASAEVLARYKTTSRDNFDPGVHSTHSLHKILTNVGFDFGKLRRLQTPPQNLQQYSLQVPRQRSHFSEMVHASSGRGLPHNGTPSTGSMPPINESDIYSHAVDDNNHNNNNNNDGDDQNAGNNSNNNNNFEAARNNIKYGRRVVGMRRHRSHVSYATTGLSDDPPPPLKPAVDLPDGNVQQQSSAGVVVAATNQAPPTPIHTQAQQRQHYTRRRSQQGRPSIMSSASRSSYAAGQQQQNNTNTSRQPSITTQTPNSLGVPPKLRSSPSQTSTSSKAPNVARPMYRDDIFYTGSIVDLPEYKQARGNVNNYLASTTHIPDEEIAAAAAADADDADGDELVPYDDDNNNRMAASFMSSSRRGSSRTTVQKRKNFCSRFLCLPPSAQATLRNMLRLDLLRDRFFSLYCVSNLLCMVAFYIPYVYLPEVAISGGIDSGRAALLLSVIGVANTLSRVLFGALVALHKRDGTKVFDALWVNNVTLLVTGVLTCTFPLFKDNYMMLLLLSAGFGVAIAPFIALTSIILVDRMGVSALSNGFGLLCLCRGVAAISGPPLAGMLYDTTGSFVVPFYFAGLFIIISALITTAVSLVEMCTTARRKNQLAATQKNSNTGHTLLPPGNMEMSAANKKYSKDDSERLNRLQLTNRRKPNGNTVGVQNNNIGGGGDADDLNNNNDDDDNEIDENEFNAAMENYAYNDNNISKRVADSAAQPLLFGASGDVKRRVSVPQIVVDNSTHADTINANIIAGRRSSNTNSSKSYSTNNTSTNDSSRRNSAAAAAATLGGGGDVRRDSEFSAATSEAVGEQESDAIVSSNSGSNGKIASKNLFMQQEKKLEPE